MALAGCGRSDRIVVGSKNFTEQLVLGEIIAQHLERRLGAPVERRLNLGGTLLAHQALVSGQIDLYPEYSGTALMVVLKEPSQQDAALVERTIVGEYKRRWAVVWLPPLGFNNTFALVVRGDEPSGAKTLSQAAARPAPWRFGAGYEFAQREDGMPRFLRDYPLRLDGTPRAMDLGLLYTALEQNQVDLVAGSMTDARIAQMGARILEDDRNSFPPYEAAIAVREEAVRKHPRLRDALSELSGRVKVEQMRRLNHAVDVEHRPVAAVAAEWLRTTFR